jgi:hypothetical protein
LIIYLTAEQAAELATDISSQHHFRPLGFLILFLLLVLEMILKEMQPALKGSGAYFNLHRKKATSFLKNMDGNILNQDLN